MYVVRHGETEWNIQGRMQGWLDSPLTESGIQQAHAVGRALAGRSIEAVLTSDQGRAVHTTEIISKYLDLPFETDKRLRESKLGIAQGLTIAEFGEKYPEEHALFFSRDPDYALPGGESIRKRHDRSWKTAQNFCWKNQGKTVLVVAHGGNLTSMFNHANGRAPESARTFSLFNSSINRFTVTGKKWQLDTWGDISHLTGDNSPISLQKYV